MKLGGSAYMQNGRGWADRRVSMVGEGERVALPPPKIGIKMLSEEILTSFTYVLIIKLGGNRYTTHAKWKGWTDRRVSMVGGEWTLPPPLEIRKKEAVRGNFNFFHLYVTTFLI